MGRLNLQTWVVRVNWGKVAHPPSFYNKSSQPLLSQGEMAHTLMGTQAFMAPEFFVGGIGYTQKVHTPPFPHWHNLIPSSKKADIWAIGVTALDIAIKLSCLESPLFYLQLSKADSFESYLRSKLLFYPQSFQDFICACLNPKPSRRCPPIAHNLFWEGGRGGGEKISICE